MGQTPSVLEFEPGGEQAVGGAIREKQIPVQALVWTGERKKLVKTQLAGLC